MIGNDRKLAELFDKLISSVGQGETSVVKALKDLEGGAAEYGDLTSKTAPWEVTKRSSALLAILLPEKREVFLVGCNSTGPQEPQGIPLDISIKAHVHDILRGIEMFDKDSIRCSAATKLLKAYPYPIPAPACPFYDPRMSRELSSD